MLKFSSKFLLSLFLAVSVYSYSDNQTPDLSPIFPADSLSFEVVIRRADLDLPQGLHSYAFGTYDNKCLLLCGRTNGLHTFDPGDNNFPPLKQNTDVFVIDPIENKVYQRSLLEEGSGLSQAQIDTLSVTAPQYTQVNKTLYITGGYGIDTATGQFTTKPVLTAIDISGLMLWVQKPSKKETAKKSIRQISSPIFQVTGGFLKKLTPRSPFLLVFGQDFEGAYHDDSNGAYTQQVRSFKLIDDGENLTVFSEKYEPQNPNYRRRDLNVVTLIEKKGQTYEPSLLALSGVFTLSNGIWTVPVSIDSSGKSFMPDPLNPVTFKQGMNNYMSPHLQLFSKKSHTMHILLFGGISYETYTNGVFSTDSEMPFTNNITNIRIDRNGSMAQYLMDAEYPVIPSVFSNPGNPLLFGAGGIFIPLPNLPNFSNEVYSLDDLKKPTLMGYIVGGIQSTLPNTNFGTDSAASPYIFEVILSPKPH